MSRAKLARWVGVASIVRFVLARDCDPRPGKRDASCAMAR